MAASLLANTLDTARSGDSDIFSMGSFYEKMSNPPMSPTATAGQSMTDVLAASYAGAAGANNGVTPVAATALLTHTSGDILEAKYRDKSVEEVKLAMTRLEWMLRYHTALTLYHLNQYETAIEMLRSCIFGDLRPGAPDEDSIGTCQFFGGLSLSALGRFDEALQSFAAAMETTWYLTDKNQILCLFAIGKVYQRQGMHAQAIDHFSQALEILPDWEDNAYIHFRRAWSYKALGDYPSAGADFETAKRSKINDPNFSVDYRSIGKCEYMTIDTEPDVTEPFPPLLPLPGSM